MLLFTSLGLSGRRHRANPCLPVCMQQSWGYLVEAPGRCARGSSSWSDSSAACACSSITRVFSTATCHPSAHTCPVSPAGQRPPGLRGHLLPNDNVSTPSRKAACHSAAGAASTFGTNSFGQERSWVSAKWPISGRTIITDAMWMSVTTLTVWQPSQVPDLCVEGAHVGQGSSVQAHTSVDLGLAPVQRSHRVLHGRLLPHPCTPSAFGFLA